MSGGGTDRSGPAAVDEQPTSGHPEAGGAVTRGNVLLAARQDPGQGMQDGRPHPGGQVEALGERVWHFGSPAATCDDQKLRARRWALPHLHHQLPITGRGR